MVLTGGGAFQLEDTTFVEEGCVLISRRVSSSSGVGSYFAGEGCILISRRGSSSSGVGSYFAGGGVHFDLEEGV